MEVPEEFIRHVIKSAQEGFFGNILLSNKDRSTYNSKRTDPWDVFYTLLSKEFFNNKFVYSFIKHSIWQYGVAFDNKTKNLYLFFQEKRINGLKKDIDKGKKTHYLCQFLNEYNKNIPSQVKQLLLFDDDKDEKLLSDKFKKIKEELNLSELEINCVVSILFNPSKEISNISSIRAVIFDNNLDIHEEMDFTKSIYIEPNMDLDKVDKNDDPLANEPNNGLGLTKKAIARKGINDNNLKINKKMEEKKYNS